MPNILEEISREDEEKQNKLVRRAIAKQDVLKIRPPRLGKHKYELKSVFTFLFLSLALTNAHSDQFMFIVLRIGFRLFD